MTPRRLGVLLQHLPPESHTMTALRNAMTDEEIAAQAESGEPEKGRWSQSEQLMALVADRIAQLVYVTVCANVDKKSDRPDAPEPIRRPGAAPRKAKRALSEPNATRLFQLINGGAA